MEAEQRDKEGTVDYLETTHAKLDIGSTEGQNSRRNIDSSQKKRIRGWRMGQ